MTLDTRFADYVSGQWSSLLRYATLLCGDRDEAQDLVQAALVKVALRWDRIDSKDNPHLYVRQAVLRTYLNNWRRHRLRPTTVMAELPEAGIPDATTSVLDRVTVRRALLTLPPRQR